LPGVFVVRQEATGHASERARDLELPIESLWVCANEGEFQVYISEGPRQITVIVFTPPRRARWGEGTTRVGN
jgi:hypothetical protein